MKVTEKWTNVKALKLSIMRALLEVRGTAVRGTWKSFYVLTYMLGINASNPLLLVMSLDYCRAWEYPAVLEFLELKKRMRVLDIGSGQSIFPIFLALNNCTVYIIDLDMQAIRRQLRYARSLGLLNVHGIIADATHLPFKSDCFPRITAISSLEHIYGDGDIKAAREIARVLSDYGIAIVTVPFSQHFEVLSDAPYISPLSQSKYHKRYDFCTLFSRLVPPPLKAKAIYMVERAYFGKRYYHLPLILKALSSWSLAIASTLFLRTTECPKKGECALLVLRKIPMELAGK
jgi:ubiquinone/menaquinone biosynthesis C-methylase UbiE